MLGRIINPKALAHLLGTRVPEDRIRPGVNVLLLPRDELILPNATAVTSRRRTGLLSGEMIRF
jgi:hypothetical protein